MRVWQPSPLSGAEGMRMRIAIQGPWHEALEVSNTAFLQSWLFYDSENGSSWSRINWYAVVGLLLVTGISAGFWTGVGFALAQIWK